MRRLLGSVGIVGLLVGLAASESYAQPPGTFSLPTITDTDCSVPTVNIQTTEAGATLGFDFEVSFNPNVVTVANVTLPSGSLADDCLFEFNSGTAGQVSISIACTTPIVGSGVVAAISFNTVGVGMSDLTFVECVLDEEDCPTPTPGELTVSGCPVILDLSTGGQGAFGLSPGRVCISASLDAFNQAVASATTELTFDSSKFAISSCFINPSLSGKSLSRTTLGPGHESITISGGSGTIPSVQLYACTFTIAAGQTAGPYIVDNVPSALDAFALPFSATGVDGVINVTNCAGDCNGDGRVRINEVSRISSLFLGNPLCSTSDSTLSCPNADMIEIDGQVKINEVSRSSCLFLAGTCSKTCP